MTLTRNGFVILANAHFFFIFFRVINPKCSQRLSSSQSFYCRVKVSTKSSTRKAPPLIYPPPHVASSHTSEASWHKISYPSPYQLLNPISASTPPSPSSHPPTSKPPPRSHSRSAQPKPSHCSMPKSMHRPAHMPLLTDNEIKTFLHARTRTRAQVAKTTTHTHTHTQSLENACGNSPRSSGDLAEKRWVGEKLG